MAKSHSHIYYFKNSGVTIGDMTCSCCNKPIDPLNDDWKESKKSVKNGHDWYYVLHHRECFDNQRGWIDHEITIKEHTVSLEKMKCAIRKCIIDNGGHSLFEESLDDLGYFSDDGQY